MLEGVATGVQKFATVSRGRRPRTPAGQIFLEGARASMGVASAFWGPWAEISQGVATGVQKFATIGGAPAPPLAKFFLGGRAPAWGSQVRFGGHALRFCKGAPSELKRLRP